MKDQQHYISVLVTYLTIPGSSQVDQPRHDIFHTRPYGRFVEKKATSAVQIFIERIKAPLFLEAVLAIQII